MVPVALNSEKLVDGDQSTSVLDAVLTANHEGTRYVYAVVNKDPEKSHKLALDFHGIGVKVPKSVMATVLNGRSADDYNDIDAENVVPRQKEMKVKDGVIELPPHSLTFIKINK